MAETSKATLLAKIENRTASIAIIGLGYVGLPLAVAFAAVGFPVVGIDVDPAKVDAIYAGHCYISDIPSERLAAVAVNRVIEFPTQSPIPNPRSPLFATTDYAALATCDAAIICVPTPLNKTRDPDVRYLIAAGGSVAWRSSSRWIWSLTSASVPCRNYFGNSGIGSYGLDQKTDMNFVEKCIDACFRYWDGLCGITLGIGIWRTSLAY